MSFDLSPLRRLRTGLALLPTAAVLIATPAAASPCPGDCNANAMTTISELVVCVNIALSKTDVTTCASCDQDADGDVRIAELITAVQRALQDTCRADFAEAAIAIVQPDPLTSLTIIDLGFAGNLQPPRLVPQVRGAALSGATPPACLTCASAAQITAYDCTVSSGVSTLTATLDHCADGGAVRSGRLQLTVDDADFCDSCTIPPDTVATQELDAYSETRGGEMLTVAETLTQTFTLGADGCRIGVDAPIADRTDTYTGTVHITGNGRDVTYAYDDFRSALQSSRDGSQHCSVSHTQNGTVRVEDAAANRRFSQTAEDLMIVETERSEGGRTVTVDTLPGGRLVVDCFGGAVALDTLVPLVLPSEDACPTAGRLQVTFADLRPPTTSALQFTALGGVEVDNTFDGTFTADQRVASCRDPSLSQCRVELPPQSPVATRTMTGNSTPTITVAPPTASATPTATTPRPTASSTPTAVTPQPTAATYCTTSGLAIPDNDPTGTSSSIVIADAAIIGDLNVRVTVSHNNVGDLRLRLTHVQTGTSSRLIDQPSGGSCTADNITAWFDDEAERSAQNECAAGSSAVDGSVKPVESLTGFDGQQIAGTWRLDVADLASQHTGQLVDWCLIVNSPAPLVTQFTCNGSAACTVNIGADLNLSFDFVDPDGNASAWRLSGLRLADNFSYEVGTGTINPARGSGTIPIRLSPFTCGSGNCRQVEYDYRVIVMDTSGLESPPGRIHIVVPATGP